MAEPEVASRINLPTNCLRLFNRTCGNTQPQRMLVEKPIAAQNANLPATEINTGQNINEGKQ
jgi:hypothetical protein